MLIGLRRRASSLRPLQAVPWSGATPLALSIEVRWKPSRKVEGFRTRFQFVGFGFDEPPTRVGIDLIPQGPVTLVEVCYDCTDAPQTRTIVSPVGWLKSLSRLKTWLETGMPMPWPEAAEV